MDCKELGKIVINPIRAEIISKAHSNSKSIIRSLPCIVPNCGCKTINTHTIQEKGVLSNIALKGEVYGFQQDYMDCIHYKKILDQPRRFRLYGVGAASAFPALCGKHDNLLFSAVEKGAELIEGAIQQETALFLRAVLAEYCMQREAIVFEAEVRKLNADKNCDKYNEVYEDLRKEQFNSFIETLLLSLLDGTCGPIYSKWYTIPYNINFASSALVEIQNKDSFFSLNVLPVSLRKTVIVFSALEKHKGLLNTVLNVSKLMFGDIERYSQTCAFMNSMNVFVNPSYWEKKTESEKEQILSQSLAFMNR